MRPKRRSKASKCLRGAAAVVLSALVLAAGGCGAPAIRSAQEGNPCAVLDSLFAASGFEKRVVVEGKATVDANDYHMRGKIRLDAMSPGEVAFEFASTILFGNQREDFIFSVHEDTVRIIDRERGAYYEGREAEEFLAESMETDFSVPAMMYLALGGRPPCDELSDVTVRASSGGEVVCTGKHLGEGFRVAFDGPRSRIASAVWHVRSDRYRDDRLEVDYRWEDRGDGREELREIVMWLDARGWRCKIQAGSSG